MEISFHSVNVVCNQEVRAYWTDVCGGHPNKPALNATTAK